MPSRQDFLAAFLKSRDASDEANFWAWEEMKEIHRRSTAEAIDVTLELIEACETDEQLCYVAAGPVEDLLYAQAEASFPVFAQASRDSVKMRRALQAVVLEESDDVFPHWKALLESYGMWSAQ